MKRVLLTFVATSAIMVAGITMADAQTLNEAVSKVIVTHPQVESLKAELGSVKQDVSEQVSAYFPTIDVSASTGRVYGDNATSRGLSVTRGAGYSNFWEGSVSGNQMLFDSFKTRDRIRSAESTVQSVRFNVFDVQETLAIRAVQAYFNVMRAQKALELVKNYEESVKNYIARIHDMVEQGGSDEAELQQALDFETFVVELSADYEGQLLSASSDYEQLTGEAPKALFDVEPLKASVIPATVDGALFLAKENHMRIMSIKKEIEAAKHGVDAEKRGYYPDISGEVSYLKSEKDDVIGGEVVDARALIRMNWSLETGGAQAARINKKRYEQENARARLQDTQRQIEHAVRVSYAEKDTAVKQYENQKRRLQLNQKLFSTYETQFEGATISLLDLMRADNQLFNARLDLVNAYYRKVLADYAILASAGSLRNVLGLDVHAQPSKPDVSYEQASR